MGSTRSATADLGRLLDAVTTPVYVLDGRRRIVYCNHACREWAGAAADNLLGHACHYASTPDAEGHIPLGDVLCPPPEVFQGARRSARIELVDADADQNPRDVEFIPLALADSDQLGALALVSTAAVSGGELIAAEDAEQNSAELHAQVLQFRRAQQQRFRLDRLLGNSLAMRRVRAQLKLAAASRSATLIIGPVGSGRQHVARTIHYASAADSAAMVPLACPMLGAEMLQASIRTLTRETRTKAFVADAGVTAPGLAFAARAPISTLLLNDVDQMPVEAQVELLGFLRLAELPVRIISTARRSLDLAAEIGEFPRELAAVLSTLVIDLPPLSRRAEDIPLLAQAFLEEANARGAKQLAGFTPEALDVLAGYSWPGQLDELAEVVMQAHAAAEGLEATVRDLPTRLHLAADAERTHRRAEPPIVMEQFLAQVERELMQRALTRAKGNKTRAARLLGMTRPRFYRRMVQLGLEK